MRRNTKNIGVQYVRLCKECDVVCVMSPVSPLASSAYIALFFPFSSALTAGASSGCSLPPSSITRGRLLELEPSGVGVAGSCSPPETDWEGSCLDEVDGPYSHKSHVNHWRVENCLKTHGWKWGKISKRGKR